MYLENGKHTEFPSAIHLSRQPNNEDMTGYKIEKSTIIKLLNFRTLFK
jgi:hypothetical protein